ncbi:MAG TPA: XylR family transcriptional regulator [Kiritimatiellia bacterium]|jgi:LacI family transcriptional regulator|nr:MAG: Xylose operon regulatory protein [Verrucomicrobia bacterium ADurb.Bin070]HPB10292.1 XylR family transcriptional regulator [Kiritimatiellia bacterium]
MKSRIPQVAVLLPLLLKGQQDSLRGILQYVKLHGPWRLYRMEGRPGEQRLLDLKRWGCTGIIAAQCDVREARLIARIGVPVVVCEPSPSMRGESHPFAKYACTRFDSHACGRMAAEYFINRHYSHFAFVGEPHGLYWSRERGQGFRDAVLEAGKSCCVYGDLSEAEQRDWAVEQPRLQAWLKALPKPVAVFAAMDGRGRQVLDACMGANLTVPDEVAVLGVDNDDLICDATFPTMSSIQTNSQQTGFLLAEHLDALMSGKRLSRRVFPTMPTRVVTRRSTDATVIRDPQVARALEFIWRNAGHQPISVADVVAQIGASRRFAERHFKSVTGRTILDEIRRVRLERVCTLLAESNLPISEITRECGFERESYLSRLFRQRFDQTMSAYRTAARTR